MNFLFCILGFFFGIFVLILGLKELKVDYFVMFVCIKFLIVKEIKIDSGLV